MFGLSVFNDDKILAFGPLAPDKGTDLGPVFSDIRPRNNSEFTLELAAILPDRWPGFEGKPDRAVGVPLYYGEEIEVCVSNQMLRLCYKVGDTFCHALCPEMFFKDIAAREKGPIPSNAHVELLNTMVSSRFLIKGENPGAALEANINRCIDRFLEAVNAMLSAHMMIEDRSRLMLCKAIDRSVMSELYLVLQGSDPGRYAMNRMCLDPYRASLADRSYSPGETKRFEALVSGREKDDVVVHVLNSGKSCLEAGLFEQAMLEIALAAEIATTRFLRGSLIRANSPAPSAESSAGAHPAFAHMLNVMVLAHCPQDGQPSPSLISDMNRIRELRDDLVRENALGASVSEMYRLHAQVRQFVSFLEEAGTQAKAA